MTVIFRDNEGAWGAIGEPVPGMGLAQLLHVVETDVASLRHAFLNGVTIPSQRHNRIAISYVFGGPIVDAETQAPAFSRRLIYQPLRRAQNLHYLGPTHVLSIEMPLAGPSAGPLPGLWSAQDISLPASLYDDIWRVLVAFVSKERDEVTSVLAEFLERALRLSTKPMPPWLDQALKEVHSHWRTPPDVEKLAARCGFSVQHFYRAWKKHLGVTPGHYSLILRLDHARGLIWATDMPISQVALETGFADQSHLTRTLVAHTKVPPMKLRALAPCLPRELFPITRRTSAKSAPH